ncbi:MAG: septum formation initiator family protein [Bacteroidaceae bacterium]|nr:septum formation initiator family protein [Bacteroidaceae bacterium]
MSRMHSLVDFLGRHKYVVTVFLIILIVGLLDENSWYNRYQRLQNIDKLRMEMQSYKDMYENDTRELKLLNQRDYVEKFARERYLMKRENEDVFVITNRPDTSSFQ